MTAEALCQACTALDARMAGNTVRRVSIGGETDELRSRGGTETDRVVWTPGVEVEEHGRAPCRFTRNDAGWMQFATERLAERLMARTRLLGDEFESAFLDLEREFAGV